MKLFKVLLLALFSFGIVFASNSARQEKLKEAQEARRSASLSPSSALVTPSSDWIPINIGLSGLTMLTIDYKSNGVIWASGWVSSQDYTFYSSNHGATWSTKPMPPTTNLGYTNLSAANDSVAIIANYDGVIFRTENRGAKWDTVYRYSTPDTGFFDGTKFIDGTTGYALGDADWWGMHLVKTTDAGKTWTRITSLPAEVKGPVKTYSPAGLGKLIDGFGSNVWAVYYIATSANRVGVPIIRSTDGGATWTNYVNKLNDAVGNVNYYFRSITFKDANNGWGIGRRVTSATYSNPLYKTTDGGATWSDTLQIETGIGLAVNKVQNIHPIGGFTTLLAVGMKSSNASSWLSTDGGTTFTYLKTPFAGEFRAGGGYDATHMFAGGGPGLFKFGGAVAVTFWANTSGVPDTLKLNSFVQLRGGTAQLTWDNNSAKMANAGGDYWKATVLFPPGTAVPYKFFSNAKSSITGSDNGWEADLTTGSHNRELTVGNNDTALAVQYVNGFKSPAGQWEGPFISKPDSFYTCYIRVNVQSYADFNPALHVLGVRGSFAASGWGTTIPGKVEGQHANPGQGNYNGANFYNLAVRWPKTLVDTATNAEAKTMRWKWVVHSVGHPLNEDWSLMVYNPNFQQEFVMPKKDTTIYWVWFDNKPYVPPSGKDTVTFVFMTDLSKAIQTNSIKPGDSVSIRYGYNGSAAAVTTKLLKKKGLTGNFYVDTSTVIGVKVDTSKLGFFYQYYLTKNNVEYREVYYDFFWTGDPTLAEKRKAKVIGKNMTIFVFDTAKGIASANRQPYWQNTTKLARNVRVTFTCNLRPAYYHLLNGDSLFDVQSASRDLGFPDRDSVYGWGVWMNGPAVGGWNNPTGNDWGVGLRTNLKKKMWDDGPTGGHGDAVAGDHIYTLKVQFYKDSINNTIGQVFKFGLNAGDNEGGKGGYGNNHVENINDADTIATIASQFGSINPKWFRAWNYDLQQPTSVSRVEGVPLTYSLDQNYPNPFNPATTINYSIPVNGRVTLRIFNVLGQEVTTLLNSDQAAGKYQVTFDASRYSSGVYFYRIEAGTFSAVKKMMLLK